MKQIHDLSPRMQLPSAEMELAIPPGTPMMGDRVGGVSAFSNAFKRGYGDQVFGSDANGIWLGKADFDSAPFNVDMLGKLRAKSAVFTGDDGDTIIDADGLRSTTQFINSQIVGNPAQTTANTSYTDVTGSAFTVTATRSIRISFGITAAIGMNTTADMISDYVTKLILYDSFLSGQAIGELSSPGYLFTKGFSVANRGSFLNLLINFGASSYSYNDNHSHSFSWTESFGKQWVTFTAILTVAAGTHNYKLQFKASGGGTAGIDSFIINLVTLGT
jgi:hypothetical protein